MGTPLWRIEIVKSQNFEVWSNDWLTDDVTIEDAQDLAGELLGFEQALHQTTVLFQYIRISSYVPNDRIFRHIVQNVPGLAEAADSLPLFNTYRLDLSTANSDPARKYFRSPVSEANQTNGIITGQALTAINNLANTMLVANSVITHIVTPRGNSCGDAEFHNEVQMRQLHRHKRKKIAP